MTTVTRAGATGTIGLILFIASTLPEANLPRFLALWRDNGLLAPMYCVLIW
jgi:hypothetical protein